MISILKTARVVSIGALLACAGSVLAAPVVVASIKPLQLIAAAITDGIGSPQVILAPGQDPHHMALRPSDRQVLASAGIVLWVGPALELPLQKVIAQSKGSVITAQSLNSMKLLRSGGSLDPHLWLDSRNARVIAGELQSTLSQLDPPNAGQYQDNLKKFMAALAAADAELSGKFDSVRATHWAVSHQAFDYLVQQRQLQAPLALADSNNSSASVQRVLTLRKQMDELQVRCLISEPSDNRQQLATLIEGKRFAIVTVDTLGGSIAITADGYVRLLREVSNSIFKCIGNSYE